MDFRQYFAFHVWFSAIPTCNAVARNQLRLTRLLTRGVVVAVLCISVGAVFVIADRMATRAAVERETARAETSAGLLASGFRRELEKFRLASVVLAQDPDVMAVLSSRGSGGLRALDGKFARLSVAMDAPAVYLMDASGMTVSASNAGLPTSFVGSSYAFRAYFGEAMRTGYFEQFALGSVSRRPGLYIARRVDLSERKLGVAVIKVEFDALEAEWAKSGSIAFATNQKGVILVTSQPAWRFQTTSLLSAETQARIIENLEFGNRPLTVNALFAANKVAPAGAPSAYVRPYIEALAPVPTQWSIHILAPTSEALRAAQTAARLNVVIALIALAAFAAVFFYRNRVATFRAQQAVDERLRALNERLVQANKLAALGQIAAGVGHEINQPLTAIAAYAHNGVQLVAGGRHQEASANLKSIATLAERIGRITRELRGFARKASGTTSPIAIGASLDGALLLLRDRISSLGATVTIKADALDTLVVAEDVRLEQVLVNLIQNALDAADKGAVISIGLERQADNLRVTIADNGPGLSDEARASLFQPFSTSKRDGLGLGLVISRDIMADFGGELVADSPAQGAAFTLRLKVAA